MWQASVRWSMMWQTESAAAVHVGGEEGDMVRTVGQRGNMW